MIYLAKVTDDIPRVAFKWLSNDKIMVVAKVQGLSYSIAVWWPEKLLSPRHLNRVEVSPMMMACSAAVSQVHESSHRSHYGASGWPKLVITCSSQIVT